MANTITGSEGIINTTFDGVTDWDITNGSGFSNDFVSGISLKSIQFIPTAVDDALIVRKDSATGEVIAKFLAADKYDARIKYFNTDRKYKLFIVGAEASSGVLMIVEI